MKWMREQWESYKKAPPEIRRSMQISIVTIMVNLVVIAYNIWIW